MGFRQYYGRNKDAYEDRPLAIVGCGPSYRRTEIESFRGHVFALNAAVVEAVESHPETTWWCFRDLATAFHRHPDLFVNYKNRLAGWRWRVITKTPLRFIPPDADCYFYPAGRLARKTFRPHGSLPYALRCACLWGFRPIYLLGIDLSAGTEAYYAEEFRWQKPLTSHRAAARFRGQMRSLREYRSTWHDEVYISNRSRWVKDCPFERRDPP